MNGYLSVHISDRCMYLMYTADDNQVVVHLPSCKAIRNRGMMSMSDM